MCTFCVIIARSWRRKDLCRVWFLILSSLFICRDYGSISCSHWIHKWAGFSSHLGRVSKWQEGIQILLCWFALCWSLSKWLSLFVCFDLAPHWIRMHSFLMLCSLVIVLIFFVFILVGNTVLLALKGIKGSCGH
jgi:hypothetical protein